MSRKNVIKAFEMLENVNLEASLISKETNTLFLDQASIQVKWSNPAAEAVIEIEVCSKNETKNSQEPNWYILDFGEVIAIKPDNTDQELLILINSIQFSDMRLKITSTNAVGTVSARLNARTIGA